MSKRCAEAVLVGLWLVSAVAWAGNTPEPLPPFENIDLLAFRPDGGVLLTANEDYDQYVMRNGGLESTPSTDYVVVLDAKGNLQQLIRASTHGRGKLWNRAAKQSAAKALGKLPKPVESKSLDGKPVDVAGPGGASVRIHPLAPVGDPDQGRCGAKVDWSRGSEKLTVQVGSFECNLEASKSGAVLWNADGSRAAVVISQAYGMNGENTHESAFAFVSPKDRARIELLDAGAGERLAKFEAQVTQAGFAVACSGKAQDAHATTELFVAAGYEDVAHELAKAVGLDESAIKPLTWASGYPIVVALAAK